MTVTIQACEKVCRAMHHGAEIETELAIRAHASAEWLRRATILFDAARLARSTRVSLDRDARFLGLEAVVLGRAAMEERVLTGLLLDRWRVVREGRLIYADALRLDGRKKIPAHARPLCRKSISAGLGTSGPMMLGAVSLPEWSIR